MTITYLRRREWVADGTMAFWFERPSGFRFLAGQTVDLMLIDPPESDWEGDVRTFSIASAPDEPELVFATRLRGSAFKRLLARMPMGSPVQMESATGAFTLHRDAARPAVFLAGGIGITPFRSMLRDSLNRRTGHAIWLFYSNRRLGEAAYLDELQACAAMTSCFHLVATVSGSDVAAAWRGETGRIDTEMIRRYLPSSCVPIYYIAGPPGMVTALHEALLAVGVARTDVRVEEFAGYES